MQADRVEISWDPSKSKWLVRIQSGEEVLRRPCNLPKNADDQTLRAAAEKTVQEEGYQVAAANLAVRREQSTAKG